MRCLIMALLLLSTQGLAADNTMLSIEQGEIRQPMPGRTVTVGYFTLHNASKQAVSLIKVSSPAFSRAELHQHSHKDGMMRMEQIDTIDVPANGSITLAPGGLHLMLFEPTAILEPGQLVDVVLHFADEQQLALSLPVVAMPKR